MRTWPHVESFIVQEGGAVLVTILDVQGSAPRDAGTRMIIAPSGSFYGTIGGGRLEWEAIKHARQLLESTNAPCTQHVFPLGPQLGQCCGGSVRALFECFTDTQLDTVREFSKLEAAGGFKTTATFSDNGVDREITMKRPKQQQFWDGKNTFHETFDPGLTDLRLYGAGHTGKALMLTLATLPFRVTWYDERPDAFPSNVPASFTCIAVNDLADSLKAASDGAFVLALTHSHASDLEIMRAALAENRFGYVGVIGSKTKAARFRSRLKDSGLPTGLVDQMICPIGYDGITSKEPASVAISIAAELLMRREEIHAEH